MDDADGGRRGLRARSGPGLRRALRDHWGLGLSTEAVDLGGSSSLNLLVGDADRRYVARIHRPHLTPQRLDAIHQARRALLVGGVPCAPPVPTRQGAPWASFEGRPGGSARRDAGRSSPTILSPSTSPPPCAAAPRGSGAGNPH